MNIRAAAFTHIGKVRQENEDRFICDEQLGVFGVADGIGGLPCGSEAAECAVDFVTKKFRASLPSPDLVAITEQASTAVTHLAQSLKASMGIGTTLTFGWFSETMVQIAHVGDSRCYAWRDGRLTQVSEDHNVENEAKKRKPSGDISHLSEGNRQALTRCIGQPGSPEVDLLERGLKSGDRYLFASDGISRMITDAELNDLLSEDIGPKAIIEQMVTLAVERGGYDNATGVIVFVD